MEIIRSIATGIGETRTDIIYAGAAPLGLRDMLYALTEGIAHYDRPPRRADDAAALLADLCAHGGGEMLERYHATMSTPAGRETAADACRLAVAWHAPPSRHEGARGEGLPRNIYTALHTAGKEPAAERELDGSRIIHDAAGSSFARTRLRKDAVETMIAEVVARAERTGRDLQVSGRVVLVGGLAAAITDWVEIGGCAEDGTR